MLRCDRFDIGREDGKYICSESRGQYISLLRRYTVHVNWLTLETTCWNSSLNKPYYEGTGCSVFEYDVTCRVARNLIRENRKMTPIMNDRRGMLTWRRPASGGNACGSLNALVFQI